MSLKPDFGVVGNLTAMLHARAERRGGVPVAAVEECVAHLLVSHGSHRAAFERLVDEALRLAEGVPSASVKASVYRPLWLNLRGPASEPEPETPAVPEEPRERNLEL